MKDRTHAQVKVSGEFACFSRPEFKVERVSYPVMTPSAARGVLEAIFWKPEFRWEIREIRVLSHGGEFVLLRNELEERQGQTPIWVEEKRQQRASLVLTNVAYLILADLRLAAHADAPLAKYLSQFERRLERGQCHHQPYLGTREFAARFEPPDGKEEPLPWDQELGTMLFDLAFREDPQRGEMTFLRHGPHGAREVRGFAEALFFPARLIGGVLEVPPGMYQELYRLEGWHVK
ncbi:MAG: type I-C CRISPR-associated protein Cas5c [Syntrophobacterales bacterium]|nr:type I-C CRISPR-associated protein Cas5c [Syntrophobacterales bacterium]